MKLEMNIDLRIIGFEYGEDPDDVQGYYFYLKNDKCEIYVRGNDIQEPDEDDYYYEVIFEYGVGMVSTYSYDLNIHWLIGFLTYNDLMKKDYEH